MARVTQHAGTELRGSDALIVVSDRLPGAEGVGELPDDPMVAALLRTAAGRRGTWIGRWRPDPSASSAVRLHEVRLEASDASGYERYATRTLWPLYHDLVRPVEHDRRWRNAYRRANWTFAAAAAEMAVPGAIVWIHGHHLQLVPGLLRRLRSDVRVVFYLPTPFPAPDLFRYLPMQRDVVLGLRGADVLCVQTTQAAENFLRLIPDHPGPDDRTDPVFDFGANQVCVYPASVDGAAIAALAARADLARRAIELRERLGNPRVVLLSINSSAECQGIERRLRAIGAIFGNGTLAPHDVALVQIVSPDVSEGEMPSQPTGHGAGTFPNADFPDHIPREVARINGQFGAVGHTCVHYVRGAPTLEERIVLYLAADVMIATPLREGFTLPALEYVAAAPSDGALVLSEFSDTSRVLRDAFLVNPFDDDQVQAAIVRALAPDPEDRIRRMRAMRSYVHSHDNRTCVESILTSMQYHQPDATHRWRSSPGTGKPDLTVGRRSLVPEGTLTADEDRGQGVGFVRARAQEARNAHAGGRA